jgi:hypothetical protein
MAVGPAPDCPNQPRIHPRQPLPRGHGIGGDVEEVQDFADQEPASLLSPLEHYQRSLVLGLSLANQQGVRVEDGEQGAPYVDETTYRVTDAGNARRRKRRKYFPHNPCRNGANQVTDSENDGAERGGIRHLV